MFGQPQEKKPDPKQNVFGNQPNNGTNDKNNFGNQQNQQSQQISNILGNKNNFGQGSNQNIYGNQTDPNFGYGGIQNTQEQEFFRQQQLQQQQQQQQMAMYYMSQQNPNFMNSSWGIYPQSGSFYGTQSMNQSFNNVQPSFQKQSLLQSFQNPNNGNNNFIPQNIHVKCKFNGENRRFKVDSSISYNELLDQVQKYFNVSFKPEDVKVKYFDEDKDSVDINKQEDYIDGRAIAYKDPENVFRISVELNKKNTIEVLNSNLSNLKLENKVEPVKITNTPVQVIQKQTRDWTTELQFLKEMGFTNIQRNIQLLEQHKGEITAVVQILVSS
jgi:hypothetical protein